jgi:hypothetical protein
MQDEGILNFGPDQELFLSCPGGDGKFASLKWHEFMAPVVNPILCSETRDLQ